MGNKERKISVGAKERKISVGAKERKISVGAGGDRERRFSGSPTTRRVSINQTDEVELSGGAVKIPLAGGKTINVPVDRITYDPTKNELNISEEMAKTTIWKQLVANEMESGLKLHKSSDPSQPVKNGKTVRISDDTSVV